MIHINFACVHHKAIYKVGIADLGGDLGTVLSCQSNTKLSIPMFRVHLTLFNLYFFTFSLVHCLRKLKPLKFRK